jgi:hypothetical protein
LSIVGIPNDPQIRAPDAPISDFASELRMPSITGSGNNRCW